MLQYPFSQKDFRPHTETEKPPAVDAILRFSKENLHIMREWCEKLTPLKEKLNGAPLPIVIMGEWDGKICDITAKRQIVLVARQQPE